MKKIILWIVIIVLIGVGVFVWYRKRAAMPKSGQMPAPAVQVQKPQIKDVLTYNEFTGNLAAVESVQIRARVQGFLRNVAFKDGAFVKKGDLLFEIEPETYQAERDRAFASLESAEANSNRAQQDYERAQEAVKSNAVSKQDVSNYKADRDMAEASVLAAKAALQQAELNLSYTKIYSPIDGKISRRYVDVGNLVGATEKTLLADVVRLDPLYLYFNVSESEYLNYQRDVQRKIADEPNKLPVYLSLANEENYAYKGHLDYMGNEVDSMTGTIQVRGQVPNPDDTLYPGMFVHIRVPVKTIHHALLVEEKALGTDIGGKYLLVVNAENVVRRCPVTLGQKDGSLRIITSGLSADDTYIISGLQFAYPGSTVSPHSGDAPPSGSAVSSDATKKNSPKKAQ